ncbi:hypothetical protein I4U23_026150 [Adineta vaga]|nr:hypothetical protein I4U23_026150 [Adineta vaga]
MSMAFLFNGTSAEGLSVEVNSDGYPLNDFVNNSVPDYGWEALFGNENWGEIDVSGTCDGDLLLDSIVGSCDQNALFSTESVNTCNELDEFQKYFLFPSQESNSSSEIDQNLVTVSPAPVESIGKSSKKNKNKKPIPLSSSVAVGVPQRIIPVSHEIKLVFDLEAKYRPRYKSDYFTNSGSIRKPRYVADRSGNHYISVKVPIDIQGQIRIDWVTIPDEYDTRYVMPYRFQASNNSSEISDCNPIFETINCDSMGIMKIYLVLIKAKQDALKSLQPLQSFHPIKDAFGVIDKDTTEKQTRLTPKQLIQKYQLGKSQLAFTLCRVGVDGYTCHPEWDTTVYSTVLEEEVTDSQPVKTVSCPNCKHSIPLNDDAIRCPETPKTKRKIPESKAQQPTKIKKQRSLPYEILPLIFQ